MAAMVMSYRPMPPAMQRHRACIVRTLELELDLFGAVSPSVEQAFERYRWCPRRLVLPRLPAGVDLDPPSTPCRLLDPQRLTPTAL